MPQVFCFVLLDDCFHKIISRSIPFIQQLLVFTRKVCSWNLSILSSELESHQLNYVCRCLLFWINRKVIEFPSFHSLIICLSIRNLSIVWALRASHYDCSWDFISTVTTLWICRIVRRIFVSEMTRECFEGG